MKLGELFSAVVLPLQLFASTELIFCKEKQHSNEESARRGASAIEVLEAKDWGGALA